MKALVAGFDPFGGAATNAAGDAVRALPARVGAWRVETTILPTSYARAFDVLAAAIRSAAPALVLCVGEAGERRALSLERIAVNLQDARIPDNDGAQPVIRPALADAPAAHFATLPVKAALRALQAAGLPAEISESAGTFVCNHVFFRLMHHCAAHPAPPRAGFLHVPLASTIATEAVTRAIGLVLEACADGGAD